jgi:hypothetical protein
MLNCYTDPPSGSYVPDCTHEDHGRLHANTQVLRQHTSPAGIQLDEHGEVLFELRLCRCGSTLAAPIEEGIPVHVEE